MMRMSTIFQPCLSWLVLALLWSLDAQAALTVIGTRFIYPADAASLPIWKHRRPTDLTASLA